MLAPTRLISVASCLLLAGVLASACSSASVRDEFGEDGPDGSAATNSGGIGENDAGNGLGEGSGPTVELSGTTYAPNGDLPLAGVLVYWATEEPEAIPEGVYCDKCVELPEGRSAFSAADGSFTLKVPTDREIYLVVQKGQFRRVRKLTFAEGDEQFDDDVTTLPGRMKRDDGDTIPKIAIMTKQTDSTWDVIQDALEKLGVEDYDFLNNSSSASDHSVTSDIDQLSEYQVLMLPCGSGSPQGEDAETIREFANRGGKVYVSDHALPFINNVFSGVAENLATGATSLDSCSGGGGRCAPGQFPDEGLSAWMDATGDDDVEFEGIYSSFSGLNDFEAPDPEGNTTWITPKLWSEAQGSDGSWVPASFSFNYGCGRGMFSIFHAHSNGGNSLIPQEKALLYMLLEVSACVRPGGDVH